MQWALGRAVCECVPINNSKDITQCLVSAKRSGSQALLEEQVEQVGEKRLRQVIPCPSCPQRSMLLGKVAQLPQQTVPARPTAAICATTFAVFPDRERKSGRQEGPGAFGRKMNSHITDPLTAHVVMDVVMEIRAANRQEEDNDDNNCTTNIFQNHFVRLSTQHVHAYV